MLLNNSGFAQEGKYHKFVKEGKEWTIYNCARSIGKRWGDSLCVMCGYDKKYIIGEKDSSSNYYHLNIKSNYADSLIGYIKEDTLAKKIYFALKNKDTLIYNLIFDFGVKKNDTVKIQYIDFWYEVDTICLNVDSIGEIDLNGEKRRIFFSSHFTKLNNEEYYDTLFWIEGIGGNYGLFIYDNGYDNWHELMCVKSDNNIDYKSRGSILSLFENCDDSTFKGMICSYVEKLGIENITISVYPNPNNGKFVFENMTKESCLLEIYNLQKTIFYNINANVGKNEIELNFPSGLYFIKVILKNDIKILKVIIY
ncbi:MAG: hypothetical protein A2X02_04785 [Bacteroidetes bacterium GWF2_29_10]|nr:MAG: hypothetical protein A2X02_04785 [Bacteroidetes bacterium GWF2_29_10]